MIALPVLSSRTVFFYPPYGTIFFGSKDPMVNVALTFTLWFLINLSSCCNVISVADESGRLADDEVPAADCSLHGSKLTSLELALMSEVYWFMKI